LARDQTGAGAILSNTTSSPVKTQVAMLMGGAERVATITAKNSEVQRIPFVAPAWAKSVVIDLRMDRKQWSRFTDFGMTLFDSVGRQVEKQPLNYSFGRLQARLPATHPDMRLELGLFPGFADSTDQAWSARVSIRLYADSALTLQAAGESSITVPAQGTSTVRFAMPEKPWPLGDGFFPLAVVAARTDEKTWTREGGLSPATPPIMR
jgi:hypothetical protein